MARISIFIAFLPQLLCAMVQSHQSLCSGYFTQVSKPGTTDMLGQIEIPPPSANDIFYLKVALSTTTDLSQVFRLELARSIKESLRDVHRGRSLLYHVYYPQNEQIPSLSAIWFNNQRYCPEVSDNITANVELWHILSPPNKEPIVYNDGPWQEISQPYHRNSSNYRINNPSYDPPNHYSELNECGITNYYTDDTNRLIPDGETALPGQWPWLVAIYTQNNKKYGFKCAGSILTSRHVITQGVCIRDSSYRIMEPQKLWVIFGQLKSREWDGNHAGIINRVVTNHTLSPIHPSVQNPHYKGLAILLLKTAVEYNGFIKPVCLWSGSTNRQDMVSMTGYVVGWGSDYTRNNRSASYREETYTGEPRMSKVQLANISVDTSTEYTQYYHLVYSVFPYCPDLGGGLVVFNTTMGHYQLRGVTVNCLTNIKYGVYSDRHTIVFFDVTRETSWIQQQILLT